MTDPFHIYRPMLDLLGKSEGTDRKRGYNETLAYGAYTGGDRELVAMTLDQIDELQTAMLAHPKNRWNSSALGRYQIVRKTLRRIRKKLKLSGKEAFSALMQDRMGCFLLGYRGIDKWLAGRKSDSAMILALAQEWASLPTPEGRGYYSGQNASVTVSQVNSALAEVRRRWLRRGADVQAAPKPKPAVSVTDAAIAVGVGAGGAAVSDTDDITGMLIWGGIGLVAAILVLLILRYRKPIGAALASIRRKL